MKSQHLVGLVMGVALLGVAVAPRPARVVAPAALDSIALTFSDTANGGVAVRQADTGRLVSLVPAAHDGFLRSTMRVLVVMRRHEGLGAQAPFVLSALPGNRLVLTDTATGQALELEAFGPSNAAEFATFLPTETRS